MCNAETILPLFNIVQEVLINSTRVLLFGRIFVCMARKKTCNGRHKHFIFDHLSFLYLCGKYAIWLHSVMRMRVDTVVKSVVKKY